MGEGAKRTLTVSDITSDYGGALKRKASSGELAFESFMTNEEEEQTIVQGARVSRLRKSTPSERQLSSIDRRHRSDVANLFQIDQRFELFD